MIFCFLNTLKLYLQNKKHLEKIIFVSIQEDFKLKKFNTFGIDIKTKYYVKCISDKEIIESINFGIKKKLSILLLGKGSNILFTKNFEGLVIHIDTRGIKIIKETKKEIYIQVKSGENWHHFVLFCVNKEYGGIENLSLIPGSVGASPIQNIGAYGVEIKEVISSLNAIKIKINQKIKYKTFNNKECKFNYRDSYFKNQGKNKWIITDVTFKLKKQNHQIITSYETVQQMLNKQKIINPTIKQISQTIIKIRKQKLPNPYKIGNAGSFFKNSTINIQQYNMLKKKYHDLEAFTTKKGIKISTAYLIEKIGFKGLRINNYGVHSEQPLVLINYSHAKGNDILNLSEKIKQRVWEKFGIVLQREVNVI